MPTIGGAVIVNAQRVPNREALVASRCRWTWRELDAAVADAAGALHGLGLRRGDRLAILAANSAEFVVTSHAGSRLGAIVVPINTRLVAAEISYILEDAGCTILAFGTDYESLARAAVGSVAGQAPTALVSLGPVDGHQDLFGADGVDPICDDRASEDDDAFILYTSGTTGRPKGVLLDHHRAVWAAMSQIVSLGARDGERYLHLTPMYHSGGTTLLNATTLLGGTHLVPGAFDPAATLDTIERERASWVFGVPTMYQFMMREPDIAERDLSSWRMGVFGAAPMPAHAVEELLRTFPNVDFYQQCGQTEAGPTGIFSTMAQVKSRPDSAGHVAFPFMQARVVNPTGADVPADGVGELQLRGEAVMKGYWHDDDATAETISAEGWLRTGDLVHVTSDGAMRLVDRLKDVIITGGRNVYSAEVELALAGHPAVADVAVIGRPHPDWGATIVAMVAVRDGSSLTLDELRAHCAARIADYKIPRELVLAPVPRNGAGKVQKHLLRKAIAAGESG
jgi:fatty-acyl-CoA synthase/feruloyl-CoA synthase